MKRLASLLLAGTALVIPVKAQAQNQPVFATGALTPGHALVLQQTGTPGSAVTRDAGPAIAGNFTELGITNDGLPFCIRDKSQQHILCFGANALGGGLISYNPVGSGTPLGLTINLNGANYPFPPTGSGNILGPTSPVPTAGNVVLWNGGLTVKDGGPVNLAPGPANVAQAGALCDGTTNDIAAFNTLETYFAGIGGGVIQLPAGRTCAIGASLQLLSNVKIDLNKGTLKWTGSAPGPVLFTSTSAPTNDYGVSNGTVNIGNSLTGDAFALDSGQRMVFRDLEIIGSSPSSTLFDIQATVFPHDPGGATNSAHGQFEQIKAQGDFGTCVRMAGRPASPDANGVTLHDFIGFSCFVAERAGLDLVQWTDTNRYYNFFVHISGPGSSGVIFNSGSPSTNVGVYAHSFYGLGVDTGVAAGLNRNGILVNHTYNDSIYDYNQYPHAENGPVVNPNNYDIYILSPDAGDANRYFYPGSHFVWAQPLLIAGAQIANTNNVSVTASAGLGGSGTASILDGSESYFQVQMNAATGAAGDGTVTIGFTDGPGAVQCTANPQNGSAGWTAPASVTMAGMDSNHTVFVWHSAAALTAGQNYIITASCHRVCTSGGLPCAPLPPLP